jgi:hypothetical protein
VGASPLQQQAFTDVGKNVGNYQPALNAAGRNYGAAAGTDITGAANPYLQAGTATSGLTQANPYLQSGTSSAADLVGNYMNPYTQNVVDQIRLANQQNIAQNLSPAITSGAVGAGQFGSKGALTPLHWASPTPTSARSICRLRLCKPGMPKPCKQLSSSAQTSSMLARPQAPCRISSTPIR